MAIPQKDDNISRSEWLVTEALFHHSRSALPFIHVHIVTSIDLGYEFDLMLEASIQENTFKGFTLNDELEVPIHFL